MAVGAADGYWTAGLNTVSGYFPAELAAVSGYTLSGLTALSGYFPAEPATISGYSPARLTAVSGYAPAEPAAGSSGLHPASGGFHLACVPDTAAFPGCVSGSFLTSDSFPAICPPFRLFTTKYTLCHKRTPAGFMEQGQYPVFCPLSAWFGCFQCMKKGTRKTCSLLPAFRIPENAVLLGMANCTCLFDMPQNGSRAHGTRPTPFSVWIQLRCQSGKKYISGKKVKKTIDIYNH